MLQTNNKLKKSKLCLDNPQFTSLQNSNIKLNDEIVVFHNGKKNIVITQKTLTKYPIIYSKYYYDQENTNENEILNKTEDITITLCPYSQTSIIYFGKYKMSGEIYNNNIILENVETKIKIHQLTGNKLSDTMHKNSVSTYNKDENIKFRKFESEEVNANITNLLKCTTSKKMTTKQMIVRNAISTFVDSEYLDLDTSNEIKKIKNDIYGLQENYTQIVDLAFTQEIKKQFNYFPKLLVYGIEYVSRKIDFDFDLVGNCNKIKHCVIMGKNASKYFNKNQNNYDYIKNGYKEYFNEVAEKLKGKGAIIIPCYYFVWLLYYPNTKIINLHQ